MAATATVTPWTGRPFRSNKRPRITCSGRSEMSATGWSTFDVTQHGALMYAYLTPGERRLPPALHAAGSITALPVTVMDALTPAPTVEVAAAPPIASAAQFSILSGDMAPAIIARARMYHWWLTQAPDAVLDD